MSSPLKSLGLSLPGRIAALEARARETLSLTEQVRACLEPDERIHLLSAGYRDDTLSLTMDSAAWCPRLRFRADAVLARLREQGGPDFVKLRVRVGRPAG